MNFTMSQLRYLITVVEDKKESGEYYGDKEQYMIRQDRVLKLLNANLEQKLQRQWERGV